MNPDAQNPAPGTSPPQSPPPTDNKPVKIKVPKVSFLETQKLLSDIEKKMGIKVLVYYVPHHLAMSDLHAELFLNQFKKIGEQTNLALILVTPGGSPTSSLRIAAILRDYCKQLTVLVPSICASAGTILALAANKIIMSSAGFLTAIDISLTHELNPKGANNRPVSISADQIRRLLNLLASEGSGRDENGEKEGPYRTLFKHIHPLVIGNIDRSSSASELIATKIMNMHPETFGGEDKIRYIAKHLVNDYPTHSFPIIYQEAVEMGLPAQKADKDLSDLLHDLVKLYDSSSIPAYTHFNPNYYHYEELSITLESAGLRTTRHNSLNRRFNPALRTWQTEEDNSRWVNIKPSPNPQKPFEMTTIDVLEKEAPSTPTSPPATGDTPVKKTTEMPESPDLTQES